MLSNDFDFKQKSYGSFDILFRGNEYTLQDYISLKVHYNSQGYFKAGYAGVRPEDIEKHSTSILTPPSTKNIILGQDAWAGYYLSFDPSIAEGYTVSNETRFMSPGTQRSFDGIVLKILIHKDYLQKIYYLNPNDICMDNDKAVEFQRQIVEAVRSNNSDFAGLGGWTDSNNVDVTVESVLTGCISNAMVAIPCPLAVRENLALESSKLSTAARTDLYMKQMTEVATSIEFGKWLSECLKESFTESVAMDTSEEDLEFVGIYSQ